MKYLILDIETNPLPFDDFDTAQQEYLLRGADTEEAQERKKSEFALAPFTGKIVTIGLLLMQPDEQGYKEEKRVALMLDESISDKDYSKEELPSGAVMMRCSERELLAMFWKFIEKESPMHYITFNGRGFDMPYIMLRSALLGIRPTANLMAGTRWDYKKYHTDLLDALTYFMPTQNGATRRFNLDFYTKSFGIVSPKQEGIDGSKVEEFYKQGKYAEISEYCLRDLQATWELFLVWKRLLDM